jgi:hypothetical protein
LTLTQLCSATTNETVAGGAGIAGAAKAFFPSLSDQGIDKLEEVSPWYSLIDVGN